MKSIFHRCHLREVVFEWELTKETIFWPLGCLQGGGGAERTLVKATVAPGGPRATVGP